MKPQSIWRQKHQNIPVKMFNETTEKWFAVPKQVSFMEIASEVRPLEASDVERGKDTGVFKANMANIMANYPYKIHKWLNFWRTGVLMISEKEML